MVTTLEQILAMDNKRNNQPYQDMGRRITSSLSEGLKTGDFSSLNRAISDSVDQVFSDALGLDSSKVRKTSEYDARTYETGSRTREYQDRIAREHEARRQERLKQRQLEEARRKQKQELQKNNANGAVPGKYKKVNNALTKPGAFRQIGNVSSTVFTIGGAVGMIACGVRAAASGISHLFMQSSPLSIIMPSILFFISLGLFGIGLYNKGMLERAKRYAQICGENMYASVSNLASAMGMKPKSVVRDIKRMLKRGYFPEGFLDGDETTLMLSKEVYDEYLKAETRKRLKEEESNIIDVEARDLSEGENAELSAMIREGMGYVSRLHELNDQIPGEVISEKLSRLETLLREIFDCVREHPGQMDRIHKLMDYYLPTMIKLVEAYAEYDRVSAPGDDIIKAKAEIEMTLDKINDAFKQLLNNLFRDSVWDVTSDAKVLETMLKQEGLT